MESAWTKNNVGGMIIRVEWKEILIGMEELSLRWFGRSNVRKNDCANFGV
jgi:hypothetical protein